jgi:GNAT superfamily N-acetyltransferase
VTATERIEVEALSELFEIPQPGVGLLDLDGAICTAAAGDPESRLLNRVIGLGLDSALSEEQLEEAAAFFEERGTSWWVSLAPEAGPGAAELLERRGFEPDYAWVKFTRPAVDVPETKTPLRVAPATGSHARAFGEIVQRCYDFAPFVADWMTALPDTSWRCYVALEGETAVATGALFARDGVGYLSFAATLPEHRQKGAQGSLLARRIRDARDLGCEIVVTETGERLEGRPSNSYRNIERAGFRPAYVRPNYRAPIAVR